MIRFLLVVVPLTLATLGCDLNEAVDKPTPPASDKPGDKPAPVVEKATEKPSLKTVKVVKEMCRVRVTLNGTLVANKMTEVRFSPKAWTGPFTIRKLVEHGSKVRKGDVLLELDPEKLDHAIRDLETELRLSESAIRQAEAELPVLEKLMPVELAEAERLKQEAIEDRDRFLKIERPHAEEWARDVVKSATHVLEYAREELKQLQKMYRDKELTEETEEIILKRQRHQVEEAEFMLKTAKLMYARTMEVTLPRRDILVREIVQKRSLGNDKAQATLPLTLTQKKLALEKLKHEFDKSQDRLTKLKHDRTLMTQLAPADGIVYYGAPIQGQFPTVPIAPGGQKLVVGGSLTAEEAFMTIVDPRPTLVYATVEEKDLHALKPGQSGRVTPTGYPALKLAAKIKSLDTVRQPTGHYLAILTVDVPRDANLRPTMHCTVKVPVYEKADALLVPTTAIQYEEADDDEAYVNLVESPDKHVKRSVKVGKTMGTRTEILEGLKEGDEVLASKPE